VFESERALAALTVPAFAVDPDVYERAGLAAPVAAQRLRAASARAAAEHQELATAHASNLATCRRLLGLPAPAAIELVPPAADWLPDPAFDEQVLLARPDLALTAARFQVADAAFRQAVWEQYPSLMIGPEFPLNGDPLQWMGVLRLPVFAAGRAAAAQARRDAARAELEAAWTAASSEASIAAAELTALAAAAAGTGAALAASAADLQSALVLVQVEDDAFDRLVDAATMAVRETMEHRQAVLALARARVRRAVVCGWPAAAAGAAPGLAGIAKAKEGS
jgi:outer membrane protein TolC